MAKDPKATNDVAKAENGVKVVVVKPANELSNTTVDKESGELRSNETDGDQPVLPPMAARLKRLEELHELAEKREAIVEHLESLNRFYISPSGQGCNLKLTDSKGNTFGISHPNVIGEMISMAKAKLQDELERIENAFVFVV